MSARFGGKRVLITGGTAGIGLAGARRIVEEGGRVIVTGRHPERIAAARDALPAATVIVNDAAAPDTAEKLAEALGPDLRLDGLWLNAGEPVLGRPEDLDAEVFDRLMAVNVRGPALTLARLAPCLSAGASVVVTSSSSVYEGAAATPLYAGAKGALVAMVRSWATAFAPRGIRVNTLVPGPIDTGFRDRLGDAARAAFEAFVLDRTPLGRAGTADEAAAVALFLLSDEAAFVTGAQYPVDGGLVRR